MARNRRGLNHATIGQWGEWVRHNLRLAAGADLSRAWPLNFMRGDRLRPSLLNKFPMIVVVAAVVVWGMHSGLARGQSPAAETAAVSAQPASQVQVQEVPTPETTEGTGSDLYLLDNGDRLKVSIYGREDLTGEYRVQDDGQVRIPTLGGFVAAGRPAAQLEGVIRNAVEQTLHRQGHVIVEVVERRPVFVAGLVVKPGSFPFSPGMTVIHATALAGGTMSAAAASWLPTEALREGARLVSAKEELKRLLARHARLRAERDGLREIAVPSELVEAAGADEAGQLIGDEQALHEQQLAGFARQQVAIQTAILEATNEVAAYERELANIGEQRRIRQASFDTVQTLSKRGLTTLQRLTDAELLLANIDRDAQGAIANVARSKQNVARNERDLALLMIDLKIRTEKDLQAVGEQIAKAYAAMEGSAKIIHSAAGLPALMLTQDKELRFRYEVLRKNAQGRLAAILATETTPLLPGDVLRISAMSSR
jgi:protein involved in polysaccharide export with SLBB domain